MSNRKKSTLKDAAVANDEVVAVPLPRRGRPPKADDASQDRIRMTVDFPPTTSKRLKDLKEILEAPSHIDVIRRALAFYEQAVQARKAGGRIYIEKDGQKSDMTQLTAA